ncbi:VacJ family lipoprotein [soil metagenome]
MAAERVPAVPAIALAALTLAGCAPSPDPASLAWDPFEPQNRAAHGVNVAIDRSAWGPFARGYGSAVPAPVRRGISNVRTHLRLPHHAVQYLLQGRGEHALRTAMRFAVNTAFGLGGLVDPASEMGLDYRLTNVDETLHVWGLAEGGYVELPVGGPGTERDWWGWALDFAVDPFTYVLPGAGTNAVLAASALDLVNDRYTLDAALESILYDSADSYTSLRISYLQAMRARLQDDADLELLEDIYDF